MIRSRVALALAVAVVFVSPVAADAGDVSAHERIKAAAVHEPFRWVSGWLMEALREAIVDATDPHDRREKR